MKIVDAYILSTIFVNRIDVAFIIVHEKHLCCQYVFDWQSPGK